MKTFLEMYLAEAGRRREAVDYTNPLALVPGFPMLGKLRKGSEKQIKNGEDLDHFLFTSDRNENIFRNVSS